MGCLIVAGLCRPNWESGRTLGQRGHLAQSTAGFNQTPTSANIIGQADNAMASVISSINTPLSHSKSSSHTSNNSPDGRLQQADSRPARRKGEPSASGFTIRAAQGVLKHTSTDESQASRAAGAPAASSRASPPKYRAYQDAVVSPAAGGGLEQHTDRSTIAGSGKCQSGRRPQMRSSEARAKKELRRSEISCVKASPCLPSERSAE